MAVALAHGALSGHAASEGAPVSADPARVKALAAALRHHPQDAAASKSAAYLKQQGDKHYRRKNYSAAQRAYRDAYPNVPAPYSFVMAADSQLRAMVQWNQATAPGPAQCVRETTLRADLQTQLTQVYSVGLAVAEAADDRKFMSTALYRRARAADACLWHLARGPAAADACADFSALSACLGSPLLK